MYYASLINTENGTSILNCFKLSPAFTKSKYNFFLESCVDGNNLSILFVRIRDLLRLKFVEQFVNYKHDMNRILFTVSHTFEHMFLQLNYFKDLQDGF